MWSIPLQMHDSDCRNGEFCTGRAKYNSAVWKQHNVNDFCKTGKSSNLTMIRLEHLNIEWNTNPKLDDIWQHHHPHQLSQLLFNVVPFFDHIYTIYTPWSPYHFHRLGQETTTSKLQVVTQPMLMLLCNRQEDIFEISKPSNHFTQLQFGLMLHCPTVY